ncbi:putative F-box domain-containing protein [Medicago truncatula]|uniref:Putative F-box domain-containing protein n=1 Tax=Medicago truncatula TaxID=3880 RepID=A0A396HH07_MEDTR|nr:putative F-box domain-containing protein [Medicago truncatula]
MLSKPIHLSETAVSGITCVGVKSADLHLQFATEKKTMVSTNEKVRNYIPDDISLSILSKLPLKSLKRFECVRKSWSLLIDNSHFMNMFRNNFLSNLRCCSYYDGSSILLQKDKINFKDDFYSLSGETFENKVKLDFSNPYANQFNFQIFGVGSVNGILCLHEYDAFGEMILLNLATQAFKVLPPSLVEPVELSIPDDARDFWKVMDTLKRLYI